MIEKIELFRLTDARGTENLEGRKCILSRRCHSMLLA